jgi:hypothetical protein
MSETKKEMISIPPFGIEADHPRNSDLLIQSIPNCRLRSAIVASKGTIVNKKDPDNSPVIPEDQARFLGSIPPMPGMQLHVNPAKLSYKIVDPMHGNKTMCKRLQAALREKGMAVSGELDGVPPQEGTLDVHRMKTLCREMLWLLNAGEAKMAGGPKPSIEDIDEMSGRYLLNPGSRIPNGQPLFEDQYDNYVEGLQKVGG